MSRKPLTRVLESYDLQLPSRITWIKNDWYFYEFTPNETCDVPEIEFTSDVFKNDFNKYIFKQTIETILRYNSLDDHYEITGNEKRCELSIKFPEGKFMILPRLPIQKNDFNVRVYFTLNSKQIPILKISAELS